MNDCPDGISVLLILSGCDISCKHCFNKKIQKCNNPEFFVYKEIIDKNKSRIKNFVLGGANILDKKNLNLTKKICNYLYSQNLNIYLQISVKALKNSIGFLEKLPFNHIRLSLNEISSENIEDFNRLIYMSDNITTCLVYLKDEENLNIKVDELIVDYFHPELYNEAKEYAKEKKISKLFSSQKGCEEIG